MTDPAVVRVAVLGARGYSGQEFVGLALRHPGLRLGALVSRDVGGLEPGTSPVPMPGLDVRDGSLPALVTTEALPQLLESGAIDTVVACLPHGTWSELLAASPGVFERARSIVDLSSDHRDGRDGYAYGLPEAFRASLKGARRVANPGCYPTATTLALLPAAQAGLLAGPVMVSALSGVSGAGRAPRIHTSFVEVHGGASFYSVGAVHAHVAEMEGNLARLAKAAGGGAAAPRVAFAPQLVPMSRGILLTANAPLARAMTPEEAHALWTTRFANERFVKVLPPEVWPETRAVKHSNRCDIAVTTLHGGKTLLAMAALDNLVKGAAGQAIQNLNLMLGWPEDTGLPVHGNPW